MVPPLPLETVPVVPAVAEVEQGAPEHVARHCVIDAKAALRRHAGEDAWTRQLLHAASFAQAFACEQHVFWRQLWQAGRGSVKSEHTNEPDPAAPDVPALPVPPPPGHIGGTIAAAPFPEPPHAVLVAQDAVHALHWQLTTAA